MSTEARDERDSEVEAPVFSRKRELVDAEMDITPMIDCVFLLLIFFIVCSTMDQQSPIDLAKARHGKGVSERDSIIISVGSGGVDSAPVYLADDTTGESLSGTLEQQADAIRSAVERQKREEGKQEVLIKADRNVAHRDVSHVIKAVSQIDGINLHLAVFESD
jgi:biopolymer transport protein ExbD